MAAFWDRWRRNEPVEETVPALTPVQTPERAGFEVGIPRGGLNEYSATTGAATQTDRRSAMQELYESYLACPWAWAAVNAISRTITAGGLVTDWDTDNGEGDQEQPEKPANVLLLERMLKFTNPREDIRQLMRSTLADLLVFGDAYIEVVWVGSQPVALYTLDSPTTTPIADEHGTISGYVQVTEFGQRAEFEPREVIHISLDSPRSGVFGVSPTQAALLPITSWLFAAATLKETFRKGNPASVHVDMPAAMQSTEVNRWVSQYMAKNVGPRNIGYPVVTKGGATLVELQQAKVAEYLSTLDQKRDEILAAYGVPPAEAGVIESGNLGGGTGESQRKTFLVNVCQPLAELVLEKLNFHIAHQGFGITDWHLKFGEIDMRDSKVIEEIRDMRLRSGVWTLNKYRTEVGEPPVEGGDQALFLEKGYMSTWQDVDMMSAAQIMYRAKSTSFGTIPQPMADRLGLGPQLPPVVGAGVTTPGYPDRLSPELPPYDDPEVGDLPPIDPDTYDGPNESLRAEVDGLRERWREYRERRRRALEELPDVSDRAA